MTKLSIKSTRICSIPPTEEDRRGTDSAEDVHQKNSRGGRRLTWFLAICRPNALNPSINHVLANLDSLLGVVVELVLGTSSAAASDPVDEVTNRSCDAFRRRLDGRPGFDGCDMTRRPMCAVDGDDDDKELGWGRS